MQKSIAFCSLICCLLLFLPANAGNRVDSLIAVIDNGFGEPVEGIWRMTATPEAVLAITAAEGGRGCFDIWLLDSPDFAIAPCTLVGSARAGAEAGSYDMSICRHPDDPVRRNNNFIGRIDDSGERMRLSAYRRGKRISLWRWIPYLFRVTVTDKGNRPTDHDGLIRIYPAGGGYFTL